MSKKIAILMICLFLYPYIIFININIFLYIILSVVSRGRCMFFSLAVQVKTMYFAVRMINDETVGKGMARVGSNPPTGSFPLTVICIYMYLSINCLLSRIRIHIVGCALKLGNFEFS